MIVLITTRGNGYTLRSLADGTFGFPVPRCSVTHYERLFGAWRVPRATYVFCDLERLAPWELRLAADLYRSLTAAGLKCLNDPARVKSRVELLMALHSAGINPFSAARADMAPRPSRFPVFLRAEDDHLTPLPDLCGDQAALDRALDRLREVGIPLRGILVVEHAAEPYSGTLWAKWGTWRIGDRIVVEHIGVDDFWLVKTGYHSKLTEAAIADEHDAVATNRFAAEVRPAFDLGAIEFGRADHATLAGRTIVYEINTNPILAFWSPDHRPLRAETQTIARQHIAEAFAAIDSQATGSVSIPPSKLRRPIRWWRPGFITPRRP
jgi:hypothetical protein